MISLVIFLSYGFFSLLGLTFVFFFYVTSFFYLSLFNIISYMNFSIRSSETYFSCFSCESCPPVKIFQPRLCQWNIRTQTGWSCRGQLSVGPIFVGFNIPGILDKMSMYKKSKSKMMFLSECFSGPDLSHNSVKYHSNLLQFWGYYVHMHAGFLTKMKCTNETEKDECEGKVTELMVDCARDVSLSSPSKLAFCWTQKRVQLCLAVNIDV